MLKTKCIDEITDFGDLRVFENATTYPCILRVSNREPHFKPRVTSVKSLDISSLQQYVQQNGSPSSQTLFAEGGLSLLDTKVQDLLDKLKQNSISLEEYVNGKVFRGVLTGLNEAFIIDKSTRNRLISEDPRSADLLRTFAIGRDIKRYMPIEEKQYLIFIPKGWTNQHTNRNHWKWFSSEYPAIAQHLQLFEQRAIARCDKGDYWWELRACDYYADFEKPKIVYPNICKRPEFTFDKLSLFTNQKCFIIPVNDLFLLAYLNSNISFFLFTQLFPKLRGDFYEPSWVYFKNFPIPKTDQNNSEQNNCRHKLEILAYEQLRLLEKKNLEPFGNYAFDSFRINDSTINQIVCDLYKLNAEEVSLIFNVIS